MGINIDAAAGLRTHGALYFLKSLPVSQSRAYPLANHRRSDASGPGAGGLGGGGVARSWGPGGGGEHLHGSPGAGRQPDRQADGQAGRPAGPADGAELGPGGAEEGEPR